MPFLTILKPQSNASTEFNNAWCSSCCGCSWIEKREGDTESDILKLTRTLL